MKITHRQLRQIIKEELELSMDEMAYAGDLGVRYGEDQETDGFITANIARRGANRPGAAKYTQSRKFRELAERHFANIPYNVWTAPLIGLGDEMGVSDDPENYNRGDVMDLFPAGIRKLESLGFQDLDRVGPNDLVILYSSMTTDPTFLASPWMILHSIFDTNAMSSNLVPGYREIIDLVTFGDSEDEELEPLMNLTDNYRASKALVSALTMKSARDMQLAGGSDPVAEMMCQELLTKRGLQLNVDAIAGSDALRDAIRALGRRVKKMAADFRQNAQGKLIITATN